MGLMQEASHVFADEETLRRKVQSMSDCYVDPVSAASAASPQVRCSPASLGEAPGISLHDRLGLGRVVSDSIK